MASKSKGYLKINDEIELSIRGLTVWAYTKRGKYLGRVEINQAGLAVFTGPKGRTKLANLSWQRFFDQLAAAKK